MSTTTSFPTLYNAGDNGVSVGGDDMSAGNSGVSIDHEFRLGFPSYNDTHTETVERTLKMRRILFRSDFHPTILSLSYLAWGSRRIQHRLLRLMTFPWIAATVL